MKFLSGKKGLVLSLIALLVAIVLMALAIRSCKVAVTQRRRIPSSEKTDLLAKKVADEVVAEMFADRLRTKIEAEGEDITLPGGGFKQLTVTTELYVILDHWIIQNTGQRIPTLKGRKVLREDNNTTYIEVEDLEANGNSDSGLYRRYYKGAVIEEKTFVEGAKGIPPTDPENKDFFQSEYLKILKESLQK